MNYGHFVSLSGAMQSPAIVQQFCQVLFVFLFVYSTIIL